jgi:hypothetical protein
VSSSFKAASLAFAGTVAALLILLGASGRGPFTNDASCWTCAKAARATLASVFGGAPAEAVTNEAPSVGTNLDGLNYWSAASPFLDLMKSSGAWLPQGPGQWDTGEKLDLDEHGWIRSLPLTGPAKTRSAALIVLRGADDVWPAHARYVVMYDGDGVIQGYKAQGTATVSSDRKRRRVVVEAGDNGFVQLQIMSTDPKKTGNYIRNVRIVREDLLPLFQRGEIFNPAYVKKIAPFSTLRFMVWMSANRLYRPDGSAIEWRPDGGYDVSKPLLLTWADRPRMNDAFWSRGVPVEAMVELANKTGEDPWFNMPVNAGDDYVRGFATYVRSHLNPALKVHVEFSNEVWNWAFVQSKYAEARAREAFGANGNWMEWYGMRAAEVGSIWKSVFHEPLTGHAGRGRVRVVYNTQLHYRGLEKPGLETPDWKDPRGQHRRAADYFDEYAVAGYYGGHLSEDRNAAKVIASWNEPDGGFSQALTAIGTMISTELPDLYGYHGDRAREYGLDLVTYESGFGEQTPQSQMGNQAYTNFLIALQRRPEIYRLEMANFDAFRKAGGKLFMNYEVVGKPSKYGSWSALESLDQPDSPRYRALLDMRGSGGSDKPAHK